MDGFRGNADGWRGPLRDLGERGLAEPPKRGVPGFRIALREVFTETRERMCRVNGTEDVIGAPPKSLGKRARRA